MFSLRPWAAQIQPEFHVLRPTQVPCTNSDYAFAYRALTFCGRLSQYRSTSLVFCNCPGSPQTSPVRPYYTDIRNARGLTRIRFRLFPFRSPLLRESLRFLLYPATEMFHFADFAPALRVSSLRWRGCPIRKPSDQWSLAPPRSLSQLTASFFADKCQGILRVPLILFSPFRHCLLFNCHVARGNFAFSPNWWR